MPARSAVAAVLIGSAAAFAPVPTCAPALRARPTTSVRMSTYEDGKPKDLSKGNDVVAVAVDSLRRLFSKSEDEYPMREPALGFTMTPTKAQRNKGDWEESNK